MMLINLLHVLLKMHGVFIKNEKIGFSFLIAARLKEKFCIVGTKSSDSAVERIQ